jgi:steroid delta-isomerase-like uncharacterized protein
MSQTAPARTEAGAVAEVARRWSEELWNGHLDLIDELFATDVVDHNPLPGSAPGRDGQRQEIEMFRSAFPDLRVTAEDLVAAGDRAVIRWSATGTHRGEVLGVAPTARTVSLHGIDIVRVTDGRIVERWGEFDALGLLAQLGALSAAPGDRDQ